MDKQPGNWLRDSINQNFIQLHRIETVLYEGRSKYQDIRIFESPMIGKCLVLDNKIQSSEKDEFIYHEGIVHPAMITHPNPEKVFIAGGGEGGTLREVLRHESVTRAVMVDIDEEVTALSKKYLPHEARGAFNDPRAEVRHEDARAYLEASDEKFDIIIIDLPDPIDEGPAYLLYTKEFYRVVYTHLNENGMVSIQAGSAMLGELLNLTAVNKTVSTHFPVVRICQAHMPCFGGPWGFCVASKGPDPAGLSPNEVDTRIAKRSLTDLIFYDGTTHRGMFALPRYLRMAMAAQTRIITDANPLFSYLNK
ncbi:polyamine aminopropyltransferase [Chloroflexota bacterium]